MLWIKAFHIIFMVTWFAGLFYLPRLFVYHALSDDSLSIDRFKIMERKLYFGIMTPGAILTIAFGLWMLIPNWSIYGSLLWIQVKLVVILPLVGYHLWCGSLLKKFAQDRNQRGHVWFRWFNEIPVAFLVVIICLAIVKPL